MKDVYLSENAGDPLIEFLNYHEFTLHFMNGEHTPVYREVSTHADIHMCQLGLWDKARLFMGHTVFVERRMVWHMSDFCRACF